MKRILFWWSVIAIFLCSPAVVSEVHPDQDQSANDLVRQMVSNELKALDQDHTSWIYRLETEKGGTREVLEVAETKQGDLTRLVAKGGQPLSDQQRKAEDQRNEEFINDPEQQKKRQQQQDEDIRKSQAVARAFTRRFELQFCGTQWRYCQPKRPAQYCISSYVP